MEQQVNILLYKFRFLLIALLIVGSLIGLSTFVTTTGKNTMFNPKTAAAMQTTDSNSYDTPNVVTAGMYYFTDTSYHLAVVVGTTLYSVSQRITNLSEQTGKAVGRASVLTGRGIWHGAATVTHGVARSATIALHTPGKLINFIAHTPRVSALIRPADDVPVPFIESKTSTAELNRLSEQQQQQIRALLADQPAANQTLAGSVVSGGAWHGGYPDHWNGAQQDSLVDSWGMYNRECVSYAAWKVHQTFGTMPYWGGIGNANQWIHNSRAAGIPTGKTPRVHSVAISMAGYYGHAMWVEAVKGDMIYVSQYNYDLHGHYSEMWVNGSQLTYIYFH